MFIKHNFNNYNYMINDLLERMFVFQGFFIFIFHCILNKKVCIICKHTHTLDGWCFTVTFIDKVC